jgi:hypothetical protein
MSMPSRYTGLCKLFLILAAYSPSAFTQTGEGASQARNPDALEPDEANAVDVAHQTLSRSINNAAQWVDSFFDKQNYIAEDASTTLRLSQAALLEYYEAADYKTRANIKIDIPRFENRLKFFAGGEADNEVVSDSVASSVQDSTSDSFAGVQYFARSSRKTNISLTGGVKFDSVELFVGPRLRRTFAFENSNLRFTQSVRWFTKKGWEATTRFDYETLLGEGLFLRHTFDGRWREEDDGYRYEFGPTLTQRLQSKRAIEYQWKNLFKTRPNHRLEESIVRIRYRRRFWRKWLFYEIDPQLAFRNKDDFEPTPGIVLLLEAVIGGRDLRKLTN